METSPISTHTIDLFTGRHDEQDSLEKLLRLYNIALIEGDYGVGKTSLGNYYRFTRGAITCLEEISTDFRWNTKEFLNEVLDSLLDYCIINKLYVKSDHIINLIRRYKNTSESDFDLGILGNHLKYTENQKDAQVITQSGLMYDLKLLGSIALKNEQTVVVQLNNLDLSMVSEKEIIQFFSNNRNVFQIPNIKWILTGSLGLSSLFKNHLKKFSSIIGNSILLENMNKEELNDCIDKRVSMDDDLKNILIKGKDNLRDVMNIIEIFKQEKFKSRSDVKSYFDIFDFNEYELEILNLLKVQEYEIKELAILLNKSYNSINKRIKSLVLKRAVVNEKRQACKITFEAYCSL